MKLNLNSKAPKTKIDDDELKRWLIFGVVVLIGAFSLYSSKTLLGKSLYQQKVISASHKASKQLDTNLGSSAQLLSQYKGLFENDSPSNILGGKNDSSAQALPPNVDNARLALDSLPITYDYPALIASLTKIMTDSGLSAPTITGTDQTATTNSQPTDSPQPVMITVTISGNGTSGAISNVLNSLEKSIRPFDISNLQISGTGTQLGLTATINAYFQPAKTLGITQEKLR